MPPPTPLSIATNSLARLLREEVSYRDELTAQRERVGRLKSAGVGGKGVEGEEGNRAWEVGQEERAIEETKAVFAPLRERIKGAVERLEGVLASSRDAEGAEVDAANEALGRARAAT